MHTAFKTFGASIIALALLLPAVGLAAELRAADQSVVGSNEIITNDLYIAGGTVTSSGVVQGSLTGAGGTILVTGPVSNDVTVAGGTLTILGTIGGAVRAAGGNITIASSVRTDVVVAGGQVQIAGGQVGRDVVAAGGTVRIDSPVTGNVRFMGGELYLNAPVSGNVDIVTAQKVTLGSAAVISGNFTYKAAQKAVMETGAQVKGTVTYTPTVSRRDAVKEGLTGLFAFWVVAKFMMLLAGALIFGLGLKRFSAEVVKGAFAQPLSELGRGLVTLVVLPVASVLLLITLVGLPFGILGFISLASLAIASCLVAPVLLGSVLYRWIMKTSGYEISWKSIVLGVVAYMLCGLIPVLGWVVAFGFWLVALGAIVKIKLDELKNWM
jgi:cytoskeletal protein CcmA (bactofilin family)